MLCVVCVLAAVVLLAGPASAGRLIADPDVALANTCSVEVSISPISRVAIMRVP